MNPTHEIVNMPSKMFPVRAFVNSSVNYHIHVHPHWHNEIEILYVLNGQAIQQINDNTFRIQKGDIVIIGSDEIHSTYSTGNVKNDILVIQLDAHMLNPYPYVSREGEIIKQFSEETEYTNPIKTDNHTAKSILSEILGIEKELNEKNDFFEVFAKGHIYHLIGVLLRNYAEGKKRKNNSHKKQKAKEMLENTFKLIDSHYEREISLEKAATTSNLSVPHFCRLFKNATGMTFKDYLSLCRVNKAEELLSSSRTITEISYECGFNSITSFNRTFKRYKGYPPSSFRK